jgi:hypothetical protein
MEHKKWLYCLSLAGGSCHPIPVDSSSAYNKLDRLSFIFIICFKALPREQFPVLNRNLFAGIDKHLHPDS